MKSSEKNYQQYLQIAEENTKKYVESQLNNIDEEDILYNEEVSENSLIDANNYETQYLNNVNMGEGYENAISYNNKSYNYKDQPVISQNDKKENEDNKIERPQSPDYEINNKKI